MNITLSQAIDGFLLDCRSRKLSEATIADYTNTLMKLQAHLHDDVSVASITATELKEFLASAGKTLSKKTLLNYHTGLSALWTWALADGYVERHVPRGIPRPKPEKPVISPFTEDDIRRLLASLDRSRKYRRPGQRACDHKRLTALRDRAILYVLLDTGIRVSELCGLKVSDADLRNQRIYVMGKGTKERMLPLSPSTTKIVWRYLQTERGSDRVSDPLFVGRGARRMDRSSLRRLLVRIGQRAGVPNCHPHRFRHTFAITALRNGMNAYALQMALGHSTMEMVRVYLEIVQADLDAAHRRASPIDNWGL